MKTISLIFSVLALVLASCATAPNAGAKSASQAKPAMTTLLASAAAAALHDVPVPRLKPKTPAAMAPEFAAWKRGFIDRAIGKGYGSGTVKRVIGPAKINPKAISRDRKQPEFSRPIWEYIEGAANPTRIENGQKKLAAHSDLFAEIERRYRVDRSVLTAIWGLETAYGKNLGKENMIDSLATLAFDGRRRKWAEGQLYAILDMLAAEDVKQAQLVGSWAGAMGMTQFIPTTFRDYAVDFHKDGNKDLWTQPGDALGSAANYLARHGWIAGAPPFIEVRLPHAFDFGTNDGKPRTLARWRALGVLPVDGVWDRSVLAEKAKLLLPAGAKGPVMLTLKNFDVIMKYNKSTSYALGIASLAAAYDGHSLIRTPWPKDTKPLSLTQRKTMQKKLTALGYDTGGADGIVGPMTRRAIRAWQTANGIPADGYADSKLLARLLAK